MIRPVIAALAHAVLLAPVTTLHAQSQRDIHPHSCARADSLLPANSDALKGRVHVSTDSNSTTLSVGTFRVTGTTALMAGLGPSPAPVAQFTVFLHNGEFEIVRRGEQPPTVTLVTDDSVSRELSPIKFGTFVSFGPTAPPAWVVRVPLSARLGPPDLLAIARARHATIRVGAVTTPIHDGDRRDIAALYLAMICGIE